MAGRKQFPCVAVRERLDHTSTVLCHVTLVNLQWLSYLLVMLALIGYDYALQLQEQRYYNKQWR